MSSTQFNKGPSYGLSAEVRNRVSGRGRTGAGRSLERTDASGVALLRPPRAGGARVNGGLRGLGGAPHFSAPGGAPAAPPPDIPRPHPGGLPRPELLEGCKQDPGEGGRVGIREERPPRPPSAPASTSLSPPPRAVKLGTGRGRDRDLLNRVWLPSPLLGLPTHTWERAHGVGGLRHNGTSKSPVSEGPTHSKES